MTAVHHDKRLGFTTVGEVQYHLLLVSNRLEFFYDCIAGRKDSLYSVFDNVSPKSDID